MTDLTDLIRLAPLEGGTTRREPKMPRTGHKGLDMARNYYDVPMLKPSVWSWEIATYFFLGGLSSGAFLLSRAAFRTGGDKYLRLSQTGTAVAVAAFAPCAPLLIADLGDATRFHYMLRVFKPKSPMNLGAWILSGFGGVLALTALNAWRKSSRHGRPGAVSRAADTALDALSDLAGIPLALGLAGYTGVLLSTTATPIWTRNRWIGPLFSAGAISSGASAIRLALELGERKPGRREQRALQNALNAAKLAEAAAIGGFLAEAGELAKPVTHGKYAPHFWGGAIGVGLALSSVLEAFPEKSNKSRRWLHIAGAMAGLAGGLALRWAISQAGKPSADDPAAARDSSRPGL